ncbi:hypothetical protein Tco_0682092 [Tanacetum coccineum]|uniref:Uncharacterized protein n=1 Tax=Tanacetum coccineum TaxID=301880 RepID=A0ABQ4XQ75_9ASTR
MSLITSKERHIREPIWYLDSGCSRSITGVKSYLHKYVEQPGTKMAAVAQNTNNTTIRSILQQEKLTGPKFTNWYRNLRIVLRSEGKLAHLEQPLIPPPYRVASQATRDAYNALYDAHDAVIVGLQQEVLQLPRQST